MNVKEYIARITSRNLAFEHIRELEKKQTDAFDKLNLMHARNNFAALQMLIDSDTPMPGTYARERFDMFVAHVQLQLDSIDRRTK